VEVDQFETEEFFMPQQGCDKSYLGRLRKWIGKEKVIITAARAVIFNEAGDLLLIRRRDNGRWTMPAGAMELGESVYDCLVRKVYEESGLVVGSATLFAIWSDPEEMSIVTEYGDPYQLVNFIFRVDNWSGNLVKETDETIDAGFFSLDALPPIFSHNFESLDDLSSFNNTGKLVLK
jgi:ADP-ribose pyrophosphatase YjhB (NUDIX family)